MVSADFERWVAEVVADFDRRKKRLLQQANRRVPKGVKVTRVELSGSYARGNPTEDSDIDMAVFYRGKASPETVADSLYGRLSGLGGIYDVHPIKEE